MEVPIKRSVNGKLYFEVDDLQYEIIAQALNHLEKTRENVRKATEKKREEKRKELIAKGLPVKDVQVRKKCDIVRLVLTN